MHVFQKINIHPMYNYTYRYSEKQKDRKIGPQECQINGIDLIYVRASEYGWSHLNF
jgi:hypothetical protein